MGNTLAPRVSGATGMTSRPTAKSRFIFSSCMSVPKRIAIGHRQGVAARASATRESCAHPESHFTAENAASQAGDDHYVETLGQKDYLIIDSTSDVFTPNCRTTIHVMWELSVKEIDGGKCEFTNRVRSYATDEFMSFLVRQGIPFDQFRAQRQPASIAHNQSETPLFVASIERAALLNCVDRPPSASAAGTHQRKSSPSLAPADDRLCNSPCSRSTLPRLPPGAGG